MFWGNANKPALELLRNSWTPWTSKIMQINWFLNSLHLLDCSSIFFVYTWNAKGHFFNVLLKVFWNSKFLYQLCPHWLKKTSKILRKTILSIQLSECLIKISTPTSTKTMNSRNLYFMFSKSKPFHNIELGNFIDRSFLIVLILFGLNFVMTLTLCTVWH